MARASGVVGIYRLVPSLTDISDSLFRSVGTPTGKEGGQCFVNISKDFIAVLLVVMYSGRWATDR